MCFLSKILLAISRTIGDICNPNLYSFCHVGTKYLVEEYLREVEDLLDYCAQNSKETLNLPARFELFKNLRLTLGYTALLLSGGASVGSQHIGVVSCLYNLGLLPRIISGSSAGAMVAAMVCTKNDSQFGHYLDPENLELNLFGTIKEKKNAGFFDPVFRVLEDGFVFDSDYLRAALKKNLGDITFDEAYKKTKRVLNITVSSSSLHAAPRMLNYITAPSVVIWSAVAASCSLPKIFKAGKILAKNAKGELVNWDNSDIDFIDGSLQSDVPKRHLSQLFHVNYFIVSQVNPHIVAFLPKAPTGCFIDSFYRKVLALVSSELQYRLPSFFDWPFINVPAQYLLSILSQRYDGDVTIVPDIAISDWVTLLSNPDKQFIKRAILRGEKSTWPKLSIIRNQMSIEMKLDAILYECKCLLAKTDGYQSRETLSTIDGPTKPSSSHLSDLNQSLVAALTPKSLSLTG
jgi:predicted acylesterase/phospholipase RssA